jgi:DNA-binding NtrC family response regulator
MFPCGISPAVPRIEFESKESRLKTASNRVGKLEVSSILIADADEEAATRLAKYFAAKGFRISTASAGEEALHLAERENLSVAIIDVALNDMPGDVLASMLKQNQPAIQVLMTTGDYRPEVEVRARQVGILLYAHKPTDYRLLEAVVAKALEESR